MTTKRPLCATLLLWVVLGLGAWSVVRLVTAVNWWSRLSTYTSAPLRSYLVISGLVWLCASLFSLWSLWKGIRRYPLVIATTAIAFSVWYWLDRAFMSMPAANWEFALGVTLLLLICVILCVRHHGTREFFLQRERYDE